jgi:hypothetical protein
MFKVGDRVRLVGEDIRNLVGYTGEIVEIDDDPHWPYEVRLDPGSLADFFNNVGGGSVPMGLHNLELI